MYLPNELLVSIITSYGKTFSKCLEGERGGGGSSAIVEATYSYRINGPKDQGNNSGINHNLKLLINNHKN